LEEEPERVERLSKIGETMRAELQAMGYNIGPTQTPIIPIVIGDQFNTIRAWKILFDAGIYTNVALPPAVPANSALLRTSYMATHTDAHLEKILETFKQVKDELHIADGS
ncbi:MAG: aminotransferase class I/II-fold pyridoxal phosphate-dependent enzyme, partial [Candidatus Aminicenantes bacterium]|nr:aminotransferase class I/II-fold pyridoxal phosphate-dependent enzyme [Candidatus Aminicenantes bacterium]